MRTLAGRPRPRHNVLNPHPRLLTASPSSLSWRSCNWQDKGARLTSQRPRPRHHCLESSSETAHFIAFMTFIVLRQLGRAAAALVLCPTARNPNFFTSCNTMLTPVHPALHTLANCTGTNNMLTPTHQAIAANSASIPLGSSQSISRGNLQGIPHRNFQSSSRSKTLSKGTSR